MGLDIIGALQKTTQSISDWVNKKLNNIKRFGVVGDGRTDDTAAFQAALADSRVLWVPGGTYVLSGTLVIDDNCSLELSQDTIFEFKQTSGNCIEMRRSATLRGNHAVISVPYEFTGNVISCDTTLDDVSHTNIPPYPAASPLFKRQRFIYDVNIIKPTSDGEYRSNDGTCNGTAIYLSADGTASNTHMWALILSGIRIAGGFSYGIRAVNFDRPNGPEDNAWNHDMRIEAVIEACEVGASLENCNNAHLAVTVQPCVAKDKRVYAKWGIRLEDSKNVDLSQSCVWDWSSDNTLFTGNAPNCQYQHIAMFGNCSGVYIRDHAMDNSNRFWQRIYYDNPVSMFTAVVGGRKGSIPIDPKYAFYKNYRSGNDEFNMNNLTGRDYHNMVRYDVPVTGLVQRADTYPNRLYRIGSFVIDGQAENGYVGDTLSMDDKLAVETVTIEENNYYGITGWSNIHATASSIQHYWSPLPSVYNNDVPIYFYSKSTVTIKTLSDGTPVTGTQYTIYRLVKTLNDIQHIYNCRVSITNARRFMFDFADMGAIGALNTSTYIRLTPQIQSGAPTIKGQIGVVEGKAVVCTTGATVSVSGAVSGGSYDKLLTTNDIEELEIKTEQTSFILDANGQYIRTPNFNNLVGTAIDSSGESMPYKDDQSLQANGAIIAKSGYAVTGFIPVPTGAKTIRLAGDGFTFPLSNSLEGDICRIAFYDADFTNLGNAYSASAIFDEGTVYYGTVVDEDSTILTWQTNTYMAPSNGSVYMRVGVKGSAANLAVTVNEEITYTETWEGEPKRLDESIYAQNVMLTSPNGTVFKLSISDDGALSVAGIDD